MFDVNINVFNNLFNPNDTNKSNDQEDSWSSMT